MTKSALKAAPRPRHHVPEIDASRAPESYIGEVVKIPTSLVRLLPGQPRMHFDAVALTRLRDSIAEIGQQQPATVVPWEDDTFRLRDGERRWRCCRDLKIPLIALVAEAKDAEEEFELSAAANMNRESHSPLEKALAMKRLRDGPLKRSVVEIARTFGVTRVTVDSHLMVVDSLPQSIIDLMDPNKQGGRPRTLQLTVAVHLTALAEHPAEQIRIAKRIVAGNMGMSEAKRVIDEFADRNKILAGRGRERHPSDHLRLLRSAMKLMAPRIEYFAQQPQRVIDELFAFVPMARHDELTGALQSAIDSLLKVQAKILRVEGVGTKRGGAR